MMAVAVTIPTDSAPIRGRRPLGLNRALILALAVEAVVASAIYWPWPKNAPRLPPARQQMISQVQFVRLPPPPPKPVVNPQPKIVPPPPIPKPKLVIPKKPKPVVHPKPKPKPIHHPRHIVHHVPKPVPKPAPKPAPHPAKQRVLTPKPSPKIAPAAGNSPSAVPAYAAELHGLIQNNVQIGAMIKQLGLSGSVRVRFALKPSGGKVIWARIDGPQGNPLIAQAALNSVKDLSFPAFHGNMPKHAMQFVVNVQISPDG
jgi:periplasmic protein TonB